MAKSTKDYFMYASDIKGFWDSSKPKSSYSPSTLSKETYKAAKDIGLDNPVVVGYSMGGQPAMYISAMHTSYPKAFVIIDSAEKPSKLVHGRISEVAATAGSALIKRLIRRARIPRLLSRR